MKAGIYKTPNGNLIYVAKDRTIMATTLKPSAWPGLKVSQRGDKVMFLDYECERIDDVPNGCTDHQGLLDRKHVERIVGPLSRENMSTRKYHSGGVASLKGVPAILTSAREMSLDDCKGMRPSEVGQALAGVVTVNVGDKPFEIAPSEGYVAMRDLKPFEGDLKRDEDERLRLEGEQAHIDLLRKADFVTADGHVGDFKTERFVGMSPALGMPYGKMFFTSGDADPLKLDDRERRYAVVDMADAWADAFRESIKRQGWRICHSRSARKHRKHGDTVVPLRGGLFAWKTGGVLVDCYPYQRVVPASGSWVGWPTGEGKK